MCDVFVGRISKWCACLNRFYVGGICTVVSAYYIVLFCFPLLTDCIFTLAVCREKIDIHIPLATMRLELIMGPLIRWKFLKVLTGLNFWFVFKILCPLMFDFRFHLLNAYKLLRVLLNSFSYILFLQISSDDGNSVSGKTPDFAWVEFQKKGCTRTKILHGKKRLSAKMDGLEVENGDNVIKTDTEVQFNSNN